MARCTFAGELRAVEELLSRIHSGIAAEDADSFDYLGVSARVKGPALFSRRRGVGNYDYETDIFLSWEELNKLLNIPPPPSM